MKRLSEQLLCIMHPYDEKIRDIYQLKMPVRPSVWSLVYNNVYLLNIRRLRLAIYWAVPPTGP